MIVPHEVGSDVDLCVRVKRSVTARFRSGRLSGIRLLFGLLSAGRGHPAPSAQPAPVRTRFIFTSAICFADTALAIIPLIVLVFAFY